MKRRVKKSKNEKRIKVKGGTQRKNKNCKKSNIMINLKVYVYQSEIKCKKSDKLKLRRKGGSKG